MKKVLVTPGETYPDEHLIQPKWGALLKRSRLASWGASKGCPENMKVNLFQQHEL